jgi:competence protein ComEC
MDSRFFYVISIGFLCGVAVNSFVRFSLGSCFWLFLFSLVFLLYAFFYLRHILVLFLCIIFLFSLSLGIFRHSYSVSNFLNDPLEDFVGEKIEIEGLIVDDPDVRESNVRLTVLPSKKKILVTIEKSVYFSDTGNFFYGDYVLIKGRLDLPENFETDTGREFDYVSFLAKDGIGYQMYRPEISLIERERGNFTKRILLIAKKYFVKNLESAIPTPHSSLAGGILLGAKHSLGKELNDAFRQSGLIHIVVLSGYNVTIVADFIIKIFSFLPKYVGVIGGMFGITAFALITGSGATVVRASIMACIALIGRSTGRTYNILRALFLAACVMVFHNPFILISDPSFQLSCMATFALVACSPFFEKKLYFLPEKMGIRATVASTLATQFFLLPMLIYMTGMVSIVSLVTNILVLVVVPVAMGVSFMVGMIGFASGFLSIVVGYAAYLLLQYMLLVVEVFSSLPFAYINLPQISAWLVFIFYLIFSIVYVFLNTKTQTSQVSLPP